MFIPRETIMCQTPPTHLTIWPQVFLLCLDVHPSWDHGAKLLNPLRFSHLGQSNVLRIRVGWLCAICANFVVEILKSWFYHVLFLCCNMWFWFNFEMFYLSFKIKFEYLVSLFNIKLKCLISFFEIKFECLVSPWERLCFCWTLSLSLLSTCDLHCGLSKHLIHILGESTNIFDIVTLKRRRCTSLGKHHKIHHTTQHCTYKWEYWRLYLRARFGNHMIHNQMRLFN